MTTVFHYTTLDAFRKMLKDNKHFVIKASSAYQMDDQMEMNFGYPLINAILHEAERHKPYDVQCLRKYMTERIRHINNASPKYYLPKERTPFIISFSRAFDSDLMWKKYGNNEVCLAFDGERLSEIAHERDNNFFCDIAYLTSEDIPGNCEAWQSLVDIVDQQANIAQKIIPCFKNPKDSDAYCRFILESICPVISAAIKDDEFKDEQEVRYICIQDDKVAKVRSHNNMKKKYVEVRLPIDCLVGIHSKCTNNKELFDVCCELNIKLTEIKTT